MRKLFFLFLLFISLHQVTAQQTEIKRYYGVRNGDVEIMSSWAQMRNGYSHKVFMVNVPSTAYYYINTVGNRGNGDKVLVTVNAIQQGIIYPEKAGWQWLGKNFTAIKLSAGKNEISFTDGTVAVPMIEELYLTVSNPWSRSTNSPADQFLQKIKKLEQQPPAVFKSAQEVGDLTEKVLPNPQGNYANAIDTQFTYSHFSTIYLAVGSHTFTTSGSTINRTLTVFNPSNYTYSWSNVNGGPGGESGLYLYVGLAGYYNIMLRPVTDGQTGITNIIYNGSTLVPNAVIGGRRIQMSSLKGGPMNFFTAKLTGTGADTRMIATRFASSSVRGYNDDYYGGGGNWAWGLCSRIKKDFSGADSVQFAYVCAYSPTSTGICDIYAGGGNSNLPVLEPSNFPQLTTDDAIKSAEGSYYNCISWSGGITTDWVWPPSSLSTYNCTSANYLQCFDNFYSNNPVRYPGAWNYTRTGATVSNAIVDLWKTASAYTHASVTKPGNNHPHGYDWESKPGGLDRTFHPRNALTNPSWYGSVSNYYKPTGTFARVAGAMESFSTDADAVKAGLAIFDKAVLTATAENKLARLLQNTDPGFVRQFNELYLEWDKTKAANASLSDPSMYCKNKAYENMEALTKKNPLAGLVVVMDKFVTQKDHFTGDLLVLLSKEKYGKLLDEVKADRLTKPNDDQGRFRIHGDHDNGVLYIEKILKELEDVKVAQQEIEIISIQVAPNPATDWFTIRIKLAETATVGIKATAAQSRAMKTILSEKELPMGTYSYSMNAKGFASGNGDIITVQVMINGQLKTTKVLVTK